MMVGEGELDKIVSVKRVSNWPSVLNKYIAENRATPFDWLDQNCCFFPANVVEAMTGVDVAARFRKKCTSPLAVKRLVNRGGGVANLATQELPRFGIKPIPVAHAGRGDIVLIETNQGVAGGICLGADCAFPGPTGLVFHRLSRCSHAFKV